MRIMISWTMILLWVIWSIHRFIVAWTNISFYRIAMRYGSRLHPCGFSDWVFIRHYSGFFFFCGGGGIDGPEGTGDGIIGAVTGFGGGPVTGLVAGGGGPPAPANRSGRAFLSPAIGAEDFDFDFFFGWNGMIIYQIL